MRLLYFAAHKIWPLTSGNRLRDYHLSRQLVKRASVTLVEICHPGEQPTVRSKDCNYERIVSLKKRPSYTLSKILGGLAGPTPITVLNYFEPQLESQMANILAFSPFDTVQIEGIHLSKYLPVIRAVPHPPAIIVDWHNIESELMRQYSQKNRSWPHKLAARRTAYLLEKAEADLLWTASAHTVTSERDKKTLLAICPSAKVYVVPNGVDTDFFTPPEIAVTRRNPEAAALKSELLFVGSMDYFANVDAVSAFVHGPWPEIAKRHSRLTFVIVGRNPPREVKQLESDRVRVTGMVEDVRPFYSSALAVVVPLRIGSGTRLKILEAMAAGVPVVATRLAAEGIEVEHNIHALLADTVSEIGEAIDRIVSSAETRFRLAQAARNLVTAHYDWAVLGENLYRLHYDLCTPQDVTCKDRSIANEPN